MKKVLILPLLLLFAACEDDKGGRHKKTDELTTYTAPAPGSIIASDSVTIEESPNKTKLKVKIIATEYSHMGTYEVGINYGPDNDTSGFTLPKGAGHAVPILKKGKGYHFMVGFDHQGKYYEYCELSFKAGPPHTAKFSQIKNYVLQ